MLEETRNTSIYRWIIYLALGLIILWPSSPPSIINNFSLSSISSSKNKVAEKNFLVFVSNPFFWLSDIFGELESKKNYHIEGSFQLSTLEPLYLLLESDDCPLSLTLNGNAIPLEGISPTLVCKSGIRLPNLILPKIYLKEGANKIELAFSDSGGKFGASMSLLDSNFYLLQKVKFYALAITCLLLLYQVIKSLHLSKQSLVFLGLSTLVSLTYLSYTDYSTRGYDVDGHIDLIMYYATHFWPAPPFVLWESHHPPFYYALSALLHHFSGDGLVLSFFSQLQYLSLWCHMVFLAFSLKIIELSLPQGEGRFIASALLVSWLSGYINSVRVGNEPMFYALFAVAFYFLFSAAQKKDVKRLSLSFLSTGFAIFTKSSAVLMAPLLALELFKIFRFPPSGLKSTQKKLYLSVAICIAFAMLSSINNLYYSWKFNGNFDVTGKLSSMLEEELKFKTGLYNFVSFDYKAFTSAHYYAVYEDESGRRHFWNALLKTSLYGEFHSDNPIKLKLKPILSVAFLIMVLFLLIFIVVGKRIHWQEPSIFHLALVVLSLLSLMYFHYKVSCACSQNFRYIYFILPSLLILFGLGVERCRKNGLDVLRYSSWLVAAVIVGLSNFMVIFPALSEKGW